jgi:hypothetical protein
METAIRYFFANQGQAIIQIAEDPTIDRINRMNYSRPIKLYKGIDNTVKLLIKNNDQKPVNITGYTFTFYVLSDFQGFPNPSQADNPQVSIVLPCTIVDPIKGIVTVTIPANVLEALDNNFYNFSVSAEDNNGNNVVAYATEDYQVRGQVELESGSYPTFRPSALAVFSANTVGSTNGSTDDPFSIFNIAALNPINAISDPMSADMPSNNNSRGIHSAQYYFNNFTGSVTIQGSLDVSAAQPSSVSWFNILTTNYTNQSAPDLVSFTGVYNFVRFAITNNSGYTLYSVPSAITYVISSSQYVVYDGLVTQILYRS